MVAFNPLISRPIDTILSAREFVVFSFYDIKTKKTLEVNHLGSKSQIYHPQPELHKNRMQMYSFYTTHTNLDYNLKCYEIAIYPLFMLSYY